ncbi:unnamed protein product, partial [Sphenostylis stenocarpa]
MNTALEQHSTLFTVIIMLNEKMSVINKEAWARQFVIIERNISKLNSGGHTLLKVWR